MFLPVGVGSVGYVIVSTSDKVGFRTIEIVLPGVLKSSSFEFDFETLDLSKSSASVGISSSRSRKLRLGLGSSRGRMV